MSRRSITVRKTGTPSRPWEVRCPDHTDEHLHFHSAVGAMAVGTRGLGNRLWVLAMLAADLHLQECHRGITVPRCLVTHTGPLCPGGRCTWPHP